MSVDFKSAEFEELEDDLERRMKGAVVTFKHELSGLRIGRASVSLLENVKVEAYGSTFYIQQVASISVPEPRVLQIFVWDQAIVETVEKAVRNCGLGLNPIVVGTNLRIPIPELNEERRHELVRIAHKYAEQARIAIRHVRRDGMECLKKKEKEGVMGQDENRTLSDKVQKLTDIFISEIDKLLLIKETEIMQV